MNKYFKALLAFTIVIMAFTAKAHAEAPSRYCIACKNPEKIYYCYLKVLKPVKGARLGSFCISKVTENFRHQACTITKINPEVCEGRRVTYLFNPKEKFANPTNSSILPYASRKKTDVESAPEKITPSRKQEPINNIETTRSTDDIDRPPSSNVVEREISQSPRHATRTSPPQQQRRHTRRKRERSTWEEIKHEFREAGDAIRRDTRKLGRELREIFD